MVLFIIELLIENGIIWEKQISFIKTNSHLGSSNPNHNLSTFSSPWSHFWHPVHDRLLMAQLRSLAVFTALVQIGWNEANVKDQNTNESKVKLSALMITSLSLHTAIYDWLGWDDQLLVLNSNSSDVWEVVLDAYLTGKVCVWICRNCSKNAMHCRVTIISVPTSS